MLMLLLLSLPLLTLPSFPRLLTLDSFRPNKIPTGRYLRRYLHTIQHFEKLQKVTVE
jgi:hypothetical protein